MFLPSPEEALELHELEAEARLFRSRETSVSGAIEVPAPLLLLLKHLTRLLASKVLPMMPGCRSPHCALRQMAGSGPTQLQPFNGRAA